MSKFKIFETVVKVVSAIITVVMSIIEIIGYFSKMKPQTA